ncbi:MAG: hypothetical protein KDD11_06750, partial [Acidobacteria bacterium]|nr:hypothetical protein [Acidobacteriota bacterium]
MRLLNRLHLLLPLAVLATVLPASAGEVTRIPAEQSELPAVKFARLAPDVVRSGFDKATFAIQYDDGEADNGYGVNSASGTTFYDIAMRFDLPETNLKVDSVEVCFSRTGSDTALDFELTFWRADGTGGAPGTLISAFNAVAENVSPDLAGSYYTYDLSSFDLVMPSDTVYVGVGWDPSQEVDFFACSDYDRSPVQPAYSSVDQDGEWSTPPAGDTDYTAMMFRGVFSNDSTPPTGTCTPDATTLCLNDGRFRVEATFLTPQGSSGSGQAVQLTNDTGYLWFFNPNNVEMVVKVLRGCGTNNRYWVFAGGLTDV